MTMPMLMMMMMHATANHSTHYIYYNESYRMLSEATNMTHHMELIIIIIIFGC